MTNRVLVVDDHDDWRRYIAAAVDKGPRCRVIGEAADGLEAVQKAGILKPDLTIVDIGLPTLNGIDVARRILQLVPDSKVLFLSEHRSSDIVSAAMATGAAGYVVKAHAGSDLTPAIDAIIDGKQFVSAAVATQSRDRVSARVPRRTRRHEIELCSGETSLVDGFARFSEKALKAGDAVMVVATRAHRSLVDQRLRRNGVDLDGAVARGLYMSLDVADTLSTFMVNGWPDDARFWDSTRRLVAASASAARAAGSEHSRVAACGECAGTLLAAGKLEAAVRLEHLWDELARDCELDILCGYSLSADFDDEQGSQCVQRICAEHSLVSSR